MTEYKNCIEYKKIKNCIEYKKIFKNYIKFKKYMKIGKTPDDVLFFQKGYAISSFI